MLTILLWWLLVLSLWLLADRLVPPARQRTWESSSYGGAEEDVHD